MLIWNAIAVADPGLPVGGAVDLRCGHFSVKMYAKMKELGPMGGVRRARPLDPPMYSDLYSITFIQAQASRKGERNNSSKTTSQKLIFLSIIFVVYEFYLCCSEVEKNQYNFPLHCLHFRLWMLSPYQAQGNCFWTYRSSFFHSL